MSEILNYSPRSEIKWPTLVKQIVNSGIDFVYIMRKDGIPATRNIVECVSYDQGIHEGKVQGVFNEEYDIFFAKLVDSLRWGFTSKGNVEIHLYDSRELDKTIRIVTEGDIISLDPMMSQGVLEYGISTGFYLGGKKVIGHVPRPSSEPFEKQARQIKNTLGDNSAQVVDDDIFFGNSLVTALSILLDNGIAINKVIPGIQVGKSDKLASMGIEVSPIVKYELEEQGNIFDKVNLGDPRNYLVGVSGLVIKLPDGEYGRAPYLLPFVSTSAMTRIPIDMEMEFSLRVFQANFEFFDRIEQQLGKPLFLRHMNPDFIKYMHTMHNIDQNTSMKHLVAWAMNNMDNIWDSTQEQGKQQESAGII